MAGTISLSLSQQFDELGKPLANGLLYFIQAGTTSTYQNAFQDSGLTIPWPNPMILDAAGRVPSFYLADGSIKIRLLDQFGVAQVVADNILVVGPSSGGGGGGTVDPTTVLQTGDIKMMYNFGVVAGFVRANGRTVGSATSGATELASATAQALFQFLWAVDPNLPVSTGRGLTSIADWSANKNITLPDLRGRVPAGVDDMGGGVASRLTSLIMSPDGVTVGATGGTQAWTLSLGQLPPGITSANTAPIALSVATTPTDVVRAPNGITSSNAAGGVNSQLQANTGSASQIASTGNIAIGAAAVTSNNTSGQAHTNVQPTLQLTFYVKL